MTSNAQLKYQDYSDHSFEIVIVVITEEPLKEKALDFENLISKFINVFIVIKKKCSHIRSPSSQRCVIFQSFDLTIFFVN